MKEMPSFEEAQQDLPPKEYRDRLGLVQLVSVSLKKITAEAKPECITDDEPLSLSIRRSAEARNIESLTPTLIVSYVIQGLASRKIAVSIRATYAIALNVESAMPASFYRIYERVSADPQIWPFLRELAHSTTSRMNVARLTLPLLLPGELIEEL